MTAPTPKLDEVCRRFGRPDINYFLPNRQYRVWLHGWHVHRTRASYGSACGYGPTLEAAAERLLESVEKHGIRRSGHCSRGCPDYVDDL